MAPVILGTRKSHCIEMAMPREIPARDSAGVWNKEAVFLAERKMPVQKKAVTAIARMSMPSTDSFLLEEKMEVSSYPVTVMWCVRMRIMWSAAFQWSLQEPLSRR